MAKARLKALLSIQKCRRTSFPPQGNLLQSFWYDLNLSVEMCRQEGKVPPSCPTCVVVRGSKCLLLPAEQIRPTGYKSCAGRPADCHFSGKSRTLNHGSCCWLFCVWGHSLTRDWANILFVNMQDPMPQLLLFHHLQRIQMTSLNKKTYWLPMFLMRVVKVMKRSPDLNRLLSMLG